MRLSIKLKGHLIYYSFFEGKSNSNENWVTIIEEQIKTDWEKERVSTRRTVV